ncbi:MAG: sugar kinase [Stenotrophomonas indicatrix]|nr:sugar kinase [Stenotrophomonas indicatrix]
MGRIVCFGELLLRLGAPGRELLLQSPQLQVHVGGAEANVAVSLSRFGHDVAMVSTVAGNALGAHALAELRRHGVDTRGVREDAEGRMGLYFLTTGAVQRASEVVYDRADSAFANSTAADYDWPALLQGAQWLHLSGVSPALGADVAQATLAAARAARALGVRVSPTTAISKSSSASVSNRPTWSRAWKRRQRPRSKRSRSCSGWPAPNGRR